MEDDDSKRSSGDRVGGEIFITRVFCSRSLVKGMP
jgi:hypothetical protein